MIISTEYRQRKTGNGRTEEIREKGSFVFLEKSASEDGIRVFVREKKLYLRAVNIKVQKQ